MLSEPNNPTDAENDLKPSSAGNPLYAEVALNLPLFENFAYSVPEALRGRLNIGDRVLVPFGKKVKTGLIVGFPETVKLENLRDVIDLADSDPPLPERIMNLCRWISDYYCCPLGETLAAAHPAGMMIETKKTIRFLEAPETDLMSLEGYDEDITSLLKTIKEKKVVPLAKLRSQFEPVGLLSKITALERKGLVEITYEDFKHSLQPVYEVLLYINPELTPEYLETVLKEREINAPRQAQVIRYLLNSDPVSRKVVQTQTGCSSAVIKPLVDRGIIRIKRREIVRDSAWEMPPETIRIVHNPHQSQAIQAVKEAFNKGGFSPFLIFGVTGSGKTEVYLEVISHCLQAGKTALVLVPEIALTSQIASRFRRRFGGQVVVLHSRISAGERYDSWRRLLKGSARVAIGARSALFAPLVNLGLIVVDEEHEPTFKQGRPPHYNARDCALMMAKNLNIPVILGSATPGVETFENARRGRYRLLQLPERVMGRKFSAFHLVDLTEKGALIGNTSISALLMDKIEDRLQHQERMIILQNRRGFSTFLKCKHCRAIETCNNCSVTLTYHITNKRLRCHLCGFQKRAPNVCSSCGSAELLYCGTGTQKVEDELGGIFPDARIVRMDLDTTAGIDSHFKILEAFQRGKYDILLGTQMVAKGLDFPEVTLVGIISADTELLLPDFRSEERTFRLLVQAAGRSGRHKPGEVVVQTYNPEHPVFKFVQDNDYAGFFDKTVRLRQHLQYPPFGRLIAVRISSPREASAGESAIEFARKLEQAGVNLLGPAPALLSKIKRRYYYNILIKLPLQHTIKDLAGLKERLLSLKADLMKERKSEDVHIEIDVDPVALH